MFVGNLSWQASEDDLRTAFAECGEISNVRIAWDQEQDRSKGFGHVEFVDEDAVDAAVKCAGKEVAGRMIRVDYAPGKKKETTHQQKKNKRRFRPFAFFLVLWFSLFPFLFLCCPFLFFSSRAQVVRR